MVRGEIEQRRSRPNFHDNFVISFPTIATIESRPFPPNKISKSIREREIRRKVRTQYQSLMAICWQQREWLFGFSFFFRASSVFIYERLKCTTCVEKNVTGIYFFCARPPWPELMIKKWYIISLGLFFFLLLLLLLMGDLVVCHLCSFPSVLILSAYLARRCTVHKWKWEKSTSENETMQNIHH